jgi:hypothetical protein
MPWGISSLPRIVDGPIHRSSIDNCERSIEHIGLARNILCRPRAVLAHVSGRPEYGSVYQWPARACSDLASCPVYPYGKSSILTSIDPFSVQAQTLPRACDHERESYFWPCVSQYRAQCGSAWLFSALHPALCTLSVHMAKRQERISAIAIPIQPRSSVRRMRWAIGTPST